MLAVPGKHAADEYGLVTKATVFVSQNTAVSSHHYNTNGGMISQFSSKQISYMSDAFPSDLGLLYFNCLTRSRSQASSLRSTWLPRNGSAVPWLRAASAGQEAGRKVSEGKKKRFLIVRRGCLQRDGYRGISTDLPTAWSSLLRR